MSRSGLFAAAMAGAVACGTRVDPTNPYDPNAPPTVQVKGKITGTVTAEAAFVASSATIAIDGLAEGTIPVTGVAVQTTVQGATVGFSADVPAGTYHVAVRIPGFQPLDRYGVTVAVGVTQDLGTLQLLAGRGTLTGSIVARAADASESAPPLDTRVTLYRLAAPFTGAAGTSACQDPGAQDVIATGVRSDGTFSEPDLAVGPYLVVAERDGFMPAVSAASVDVTTGASADAGKLTLVSGAQMLRFVPPVDPAADPASPATRHLALGLTVVVPPVYNGMRISADPTFADPQQGETGFAAVQNTLNWTLQPGDGQRSLFVQFRAPTCRVSPVFEGTLVVDTTAPAATAPQLPLGGSCTNSAQITLQLGGSDTCPTGQPCAGLYKMRLALDGVLDTEPWIDFAPQLAVNLGADGVKPLAFALRDRAGNESTPATASVTVNSTGPVVASPAFLVNGATGATTAHSLDVSLTFQATGATFVEVGNASGLDGSGFFAFPVTHSAAWRLLDGADGPRTVVVRYRDDCGNVTPEYQVQIALDRSSRLLGSARLSGASASDLTGVSALLLVSGTYVDIGKSTVTGPDGAFAISGLAAGTYRLAFAHDGYVSRTIDGLALAAGTDLLVPEISLDVARGDIAGTATLQGESASDGIRVSAGGAVALTDATGAYRLSGLQVGQYLVQAEKGADYSPTSTASLVTVTLGGTATAPGLTLAPVPGGVKGSAALAGKSVRSGIDVLVQGFTVAGTAQTRSTFTDSNGAFSITDLTAGTYTALVSAPGYRTSTQDGLVVSPNTTVDLGSLTLQPATGEVVGKATLYGASSSAGVRASLAQSGVEIAYAISGDDGTYDVKAVPAGTYALTLSRLGFGSVTISSVQVDADALVQIPAQTLNAQVGQVQLVGTGAATNQTTVQITGNYPNAVSARFCEDPAVTDPSTFTLVACPRTTLAFTAAPPNFDAVSLTFKATACPGSTSNVICDGAKEIFVQFHDSAGADSSWFTLPVVLDRRPPAGNVVLSPLDSTLVAGAVADQGAKYTRTLGVSVLIVAADDTSGVPSGGAVSGLVQAYLYRSATDANPLIVPMSDGTRLLQGVNLAAGADGPRPLYLVLVDGAGNASATDLSTVTCPDPLGTAVPTGCDSIFLKTSPPTSVAFSIDPVNPTGDLSVSAAYALSPLVQLGIDSTLTGQLQDQAVEATLSNDPNFTSAFVQPLPAPRAILDWVLTAGDGPKTVYLKVRDGAGNLSAAFQASTTLATVTPDVPVPSSVGALTRNKRPALSFGAVSGATGYQVQLATSGAFSSLITLSPASPLTGTSTAPAANLADGSYDWRVRSFDAAGHQSAWSNPDVFTVDTTPPAVPVLNAVKSPTNLNTPALGWTPVAGAASYVVQLDTSATFNSTSLITASALASSFVPGALADGTWYAQVAAVDAAGNASADSTAISFTVKTVAPANPALTGPASGAVLSTSSVSVTWNAISDAADYLLQISSDPGLANPDQYTVTGTQRTLVLANGSWTIRVGAVDAAGNASNLAAASTRTFTVDNAAPVGATLAINNGATWTTSLGVTLSLSAAADVTLMSIAEAATLDCSAATYQSFATTKAFTLGGQGLRTVTACFKTAAGLTASASASINVNTSPPTATLAIAGGATYVRQQATTLALTVSPDVISMALANATTLDCSTATYQPYSASLAWTLSTGDGSKTVSACVKNAAGATGSTSATITLDTVAPSAATLAINSGAATTTSKSVTLSMTTPETVTVALANETLDCASATYGAFVTAWTLTDQDGVRTVVACFKDNAGWVVSKSASILLDRVAPAGTVTINGGATYATSLGVTLAFTSMPDVQTMAYGEGINCTTATFSTFQPTASYTLGGQGTRTVIACYKDAAGNLAQASASIIADTIAPTGSLTVAGGTGYSQTTQTTIALTASSDVIQMAVVNGTLASCASVIWEPYSASKVWTLTSTNGLQTVSACLKNAAGLTAIVSGTVTLNTNPPSTATLAINSGATTTTSKSVTLSMTSPETVTVALANETLDCSSATYGAFTSSWTLLDQDGVRTVVACFKDAAGWVVQKSATILLDRSTPNGTIAIAGGAAYTQSKLVDLTFTAPSDTTQYAIANGSLTCASATYLTYVPSYSGWDLDPANTGVDGLKTVAVCFKNVAGTTAQASASITLDRVDPTGTLVLAGGATAVPQRAINVQVQNASSGVVSMAVGEGISCASAAYFAFNASITYVLSTTDGQKTVIVCLQKASGRQGQLSQQVTLITTPPTGTVSINSGATWTNSSTYTVSVTGSSASATQYAIANESIDCVAASYSSMSASFTRASWSLFPVDGLRTVQVCFKDAAGNLGQAQATISADTHLPVISQLLIAGGAAATTTELVTLSILATDNLSAPAQMQMYLSRDGTFTDGAWETYATSKSWTLNGTATPATETRYVYLQVKDAAGNVSAPANAHIIVDLNDPTIGSIATDVGTAPQPVSHVHVTFNSTSATAPATLVDMQVSEDSAFAAATWQPYLSPVGVLLSANDGPKTLYAKVRDIGQRVSGVASTTVILDTTAPAPGPATPAIALSSGWAKSSTLSVSLVATDTNATAAGGLSFALLDAQGAGTCATATYSTFVSAGGSCSGVTCTLNNYSFAFPSAVEGPHVLGACFKDGAGNKSPAPATASFSLDLTLPTTPPGLTLQPGSRQMLASWGTSTDGGSGIDHYRLQVTGPSGTSLIEPVNGTSYVIPGLTNRVPYTVAVAAVDKAGNVGAYSTSATAVTGFRLGTVAQESDATSQYSSVAYAEGTINIANVRSSPCGYPAESLSRCDALHADCSQSANWRQVPLCYETGRAVYLGPTGLVSDVPTPVTAVNDKLFMVAIETIAPSGCPNYGLGGSWTTTSCFVPSVLACLNGNCDTYYYWSHVDLEAPSYIGWGAVSITSNSSDVYLSYRTNASGNPVRIRRCSFIGSDCSSAGNWATTDLSNSSGTTASLVANDHLAAAGWMNTSYGFIVSTLRTDNYTGWNTDSWSAPAQAFGITDVYNANLAHLAITNDKLYGFASRTYGASGIASRCSLSDASNCTAGTSWSAPTAVPALGGFDVANIYPQPFAITAGMGGLHATWWDANAQTLDYANCADGLDCTAQANWHSAALEGLIGLRTIPGIATYDANVLISWFDTDSHTRVMMPWVTSPLLSGLVPSSAQMAANWSPVPGAGGYQQLYGSAGGPNWANASLISDPLLDQNLVTVGPLTQIYGAMRTVDPAGQLSDDGPSVRMTTFRDQNIPINQTTAGQCNYNIPTNSNCERYITATVGTKVVIYNEGDSLNQSTISYCDQAIASGPGSCAAGMTIVPLGPAGEKPIGLYGTPTRVWALSYFYYSDPDTLAVTEYTALRWCDFTGGGCGNAGNWSGYSQLPITNLWAPYNGMIYYEAKDAAAVAADLSYVYVVELVAGGALQLNYCYLPNNCTLDTSWVKNQTVDTTLTRSLQLVMDPQYGGAFFIAQGTDSGTRLHWCYYPSGCTTSVGFPHYLSTIVAQAPLAMTERLAVDPTGQMLTLSGIWNNQMHVMTCNGGPGGGNVCVGSPRQWGLATLGPARNGTGINADVANSSTRRYAFWSDANERMLATCQNDCGRSDRWTRARVTTQSYPSAGMGQPSISVTPSDSIAIVFSQYNQLIRLWSEGQLLPLR
jgi:hypothetical protein